jgi:hypothetical protein
MGLSNWIKKLERGSRETILGPCKEVLPKLKSA